MLTQSTRSTKDPVSTQHLSFFAAKRPSIARVAHVNSWVFPCKKFDLCCLLPAAAADANADANADADANMIDCVTADSHYLEGTLLSYTAGS